MKLINVYYLLILIKISLTIIPLWNFNSSAIDLLTDAYNHIHEYYVADNRDVLGKKFSLKKKIYIENNEVKQKNYLFIEEMYYGIVNYDDIESVYYNHKKDSYYVCPKGKYNPYSYPKGTDELNENDVDNSTINWHLSCFLQHNLGGYNDENRALYLFYLGNSFEIYLHNFDKIVKKQLIHKGIFAYKWRTTTSNYKGQQYKQMVWILNVDGNIILEFPIISFSYDTNTKTNLFYYDGSNNILKKLDVIKSDFLANFLEESYNFYWINYNKYNISDFSSGYNKLTDSIFVDNNVVFENYNLVKNLTSPFEFLDNVTIDTIDYIPGKKYVYYKLYNHDKNINYYGVYDVYLNKVIFNTDEELLEFKPYNNSAMLAITNRSAYIICMLRYRGNCVEKCPQGLYEKYDSTTYNRCGHSENCSMKLMPNNICIDSCDPNIYIQIGNECWLCKDYKQEGIYKLVNTTGCIKEKLNNTIFINEYLNLITCHNDYKYDNESGLCVLKNCHSNCQGCYANSNGDNEQNCIKCKNIYHFLEKGNCVNKCSENYFSKEQKCYECDESCKTCENEAKKCTSCIEGKFLNKGNSKCEKCSEYCLECFARESNESQNCKNCNETSNYTILFNNNCLDKCPKNMSLYNKTCYDKCPGKLVLFDNNCLDNCPENLFLFNKDCVEQCPENMLLFNSNCLDKCPANMVLFNKTCFDKFPGKMILLNNNCLDNCPEDLFLFNNECVKQCPKNMVWDKGRVCKKNNSSKNSNVMLIIYIIIAAVLLLLILFFFYKRYTCTTTNLNEIYIDEINSIIIDDKNIFD